MVYMCIYTYIYARKRIGKTEREKKERERKRIIVTGGKYWRKKKFPSIIETELFLLSLATLCIYYVWIYSRVSTACMYDILMLVAACILLL